MNELMLMKLNAVVVYQSSMCIKEDNSGPRNIKGDNSGPRNIKGDNSGPRNIKGDNSREIIICVGLVSFVI